MWSWKIVSQSTQLQTVPTNFAVPVNFSISIHSHSADDANEWVGSTLWEGRHRVAQAFPFWLLLLKMSSPGHCLSPKIYSAMFLKTMTLFAISMRWSWLPFIWLSIVLSGLKFLEPFREPQRANPKCTKLQWERSLAESPQEIGRKWVFLDGRATPGRDRQSTGSRYERRHLARWLPPSPHQR